MENREYIYNTFYKKAKKLFFYNKKLELPQDIQLFFFAKLC